MSGVTSTCAGQIVFMTRWKVAIIHREAGDKSRTLELYSILDPLCKSGLSYFVREPSSRALRTVVSLYSPPSTEKRCFYISKLAI